MNELPPDYVAIHKNDIQDIIDYLGGYMGSVSDYRNVEELRKRLRSILKDEKGKV